MLEHFVILTCRARLRSVCWRRRLPLGFHYTSVSLSLSLALSLSLSLSLWFYLDWDDYAVMGGLVVIILNSTRNNYASLSLSTIYDQLICPHWGLCQGSSGVSVCHPGDRPDLLSARHNTANSASQASSRPTGESRWLSLSKVTRELRQDSYMYRLTVISVIITCLCRLCFAFEIPFRLT